MSSGIRIMRICEFCGQEFEAKTTVTKYCTHKCNSRAYKEKQRRKKIKQSNLISHKIKFSSIDEIKAKEVLNVRETALLLGVSIRTVYRLLDKGIIQGVNLGDRLTRIKRSHLNRILGEYEEPEIKEPILKNSIKFKDCYKLEEVRKKYEISDRVLYELVKRNNIPTIRKGKFGYVPKEMIHEILE
ncbi:MAG: excisionase family DNA binding protein [Crocinitomix sp.]|jgi:excisionase family DNA binding protein